MGSMIARILAFCIRMGSRAVNWFWTNKGLILRWIRDGLAFDWIINQIQRRIRR